MKQDKTRLDRCYREIPSKLVFPPFFVFGGIHTIEFFSTVDWKRFLRKWITFQESAKYYENYEKMTSTIQQTLLCVCTVQTVHVTWLMRTNKPGFLFGLDFDIVGLKSKVRPFLASEFCPRLARQVGFSVTLTLWPVGPIIAFLAHFHWVFSPFLSR